MVRRIGAGGMAEVFQCRLSGIGGFDKKVVVKRIRPELAADPHFVDMFLDEARIAANLSHSNIIQIFEIDEIGGLPYIAMEYLRGPTLSLLIQQTQAQHRPHFGVMAKVMAGICGALDYAHHAADGTGKPLNIIHRDVTPQNILVSLEGVPKLLDFGVAKARGQIAHTSAGSIKGKFKFMAPEAFHGTGVTGALDVFAAGVCLYQATTFALPYDGEGELEVMRAAAAGQYPKPSALVPGFCPKLEAIILSAMAPNAKDRCASARLLQQQLEAYAHDQGVTQETVADHVRALFPNAVLDGETVADVQSSDIVVTPAREGRSAMLWGPPAAPPRITVPMRAIDDDGSVDVDLDDEPEARRGASRRPAGWMIAAALAVLVLAAIAAFRPRTAVVAQPAPPPEPRHEAVTAAQPPPLDVAKTLAAGRAAFEQGRFVEAAALARQVLAVQLDEPQALALLKDATEAVRRPRPPPARPAPRNGGLTIETEPVAQVFLNGKALGLSPIRRQVLLEGTYQVSARHAKREPAVKDVTVVGGRETVVQLHLAEKPRPAPRAVVAKAEPPPAPEPEPAPEPVAEEPVKVAPPPVPAPAPVVAAPAAVVEAPRPTRHVAPAGLSFECPDAASLVVEGAQAWCETADGEKHGRFVRLYPNGRKAEEGEYRRGKKHGRWLDFYEQGGERQRVEWRKGVQAW